MAVTIKELGRRLATKLASREDVSALTLGPVEFNKQAQFTDAAGTPIGPEIKLAEAVTPPEQTRGLICCPLPKNSGMLFKLASPDVGFWMPGVPAPLDLAFLDAKKDVVEIRKMATVSPGEEPPIYQADCINSAYAVELPAGWCRENGVTPGTQLNWETTDGISRT